MTVFAQTLAALLLFAAGIYVGFGAVVLAWMNFAFGASRRDWIPPAAMTGAAIALVYFAYLAMPFSFASTAR